MRTALCQLTTVGLRWLTRSFQALCSRCDAITCAPQCDRVRGVRHSAACAVQAMPVPNRALFYQLCHALHTVGAHGTGALPLVRC